MLSARLAAVSALKETMLSARLAAVSVLKETMLSAGLAAVSALHLPFCQLYSKKEF